MLDRAWHGVARARATSGIAFQALSNKNTQVAAVEGGTVNLNPLTSTLKRLNAATGDTYMRHLADVSPINYAMAQGAEDFYGLTYSRKTQSGGEVLKAFQRDSYIRMTAGAGDQVSSEKITMLAQDALDLEIQIGDGRAVKVGSKEFYENSRINSFIESHVQPGLSDIKMPATTNYIFSPQNLTQESYENLADQVIGSQIRRFQAIGQESGNFVAESIKGDFNAVTAKIFGDSVNFDEAASQYDFGSIFAKGLSPEERIALIRQQAGEEAANRYRDFIKMTSLEIQEDGIIFMSVKGEASEEIRAAQRTTGVELNSTINEQMSRSRRLRMVAAIEEIGSTGETRPVAFALSPLDDQQVYEEARMAADSSLSVEDIGRLRHQEDLNALQNAAEAARVTGTNSRNVAAEGATEFIADAAAAASSRASGAASKAKTFSDLGTTFMKNNKNKIYLAGLAVAAAYAGTKVAKRKNENEVYDATMQGMPVESGKRPYGIQDALFAQKMASRRKDPLVTAGVVGNLDRSKINHTSMGPDKNNHLFGG